MPAGGAPGLCGGDDEGGGGTASAARDLHMLQGVPPIRLLCFQQLHGLHAGGLGHDVGLALVDQRVQDPPDRLQQG